METASPLADVAGLPRARWRWRWRLPLRAMGMLGILALITLTTLMVASALLFRDAVQTHLQQLEEATTRHAALLQRQAWAIATDPARVAELEPQVRAAADEREVHLLTTRHYIDASTITLASLGWLGITSIGSLALLFFSRLAGDIRALRGRALAILQGDRCGATPLPRLDELGDLSQSVEELAEALGRRERELALERRHAMHQEKLATLGSMAAGVIREIGNPIAAIDGYARVLLEARGGEDTGELRAILQETARLVAISREISTLAAAPAAQWQLASVNEIVGQTLALLRYEPRLGNVRITTVLDPQLPAVMASPDRLLQMLTTVILSDADATTTLPRHAAEIVITTRLAAGGVALSIESNGGARELQGAPLCRSVVEAHGGRISMVSRPEGGTRVAVWLPLAAEGR
jgi:two-component system NtrC family sensor kinase